MLSDNGQLTMEPAVHQTAFTTKRCLGSPNFGILAGESSVGVGQPDLLLMRGQGKDLIASKKHTAGRTPQVPRTKSKISGDQTRDELMPSVIKHAQFNAIPVLPLIPSDVKKLGDQVGGPAKTRVALAEEDKPCLLHSSPMHTNPAFNEGIPPQGLLGLTRREEFGKCWVLWRNQRRWTRMTQFPPKKRRTDVVCERWKSGGTLQPGTKRCDGILPDLHRLRLPTSPHMVRRFVLAAPRTSSMILTTPQEHDLTHRWKTSRVLYNPLAPRQLEG